MINILPFILVHAVSAEAISEGRKDDGRKENLINSSDDAILKKISYAFKI